jgi:hypothetical protein
MRRSTWSVTRWSCAATPAHSHRRCNRRWSRR